MMKVMDPQTTCSYCRGNISAADYFCPRCGKKLKDKPLSVAPVRQLLVYLLSFFLPPLGLWPAVKYWRQGDEKSKKIALVAFGLTIISIVVNSWLAIAFLNLLNKGIGGQLNLYENMGY